MTVSKAAATVTLSRLSQTYTGSALAATVTTNPAGLNVSLFAWAAYHFRNLSRVLQDGLFCLHGRQTLRCENGSHIAALILLMKYPEAL
jgi:hypothetical protein